MTAGERLKIARKAASLSGQALGEMIGVSKAQVSNIEKGVSDLSKSNAIVLSDKLGVKLNWLLTGEGEMMEAGASQSVTVGRIRGDQNNTGFGTQTVNDGKAEYETKINRLETENQHLKELIQEKDERIQELKEMIAYLKSKS